MNPNQYADHYFQQVEKYIDDILNDRIVHGKLERKSVELFIKKKDKYQFKPDQVRKVFKFFSLLNINHKNKVSQFKLLDYQAFIIWNVYGLYIDDRTRLIDTVIFSSAKKQGKALCIDTPIITPTGWTTMNNLKVGDQVFAENGKVCNVTYTSPVYTNRDLYEITFTDKTKIYADADHNWLTTARYTYQGRGKGIKTKVRTTKEILDTLYYGSENKKYKNYNHRIKLNSCLEFPEQKLPVHPYVLGYWLGDGDNSSNRVTTSMADYNELHKYINDCGYNSGNTHYWNTHNNNNQAICFTISKKKHSLNDLKSILKDLNLLYNKHIPEIYLRSSREQRLELLRGLMDSDGWCERKSKCCFNNTKKELAFDVYELVRGLGFKASICEGDAKLNGRFISKCWDVNFTAWNDTPVFKLQRKFKKQLPNPNKSNLTALQYLAIKSIEPVPSRPVKCITVDSPNNLFLAGKQLIPTHNTSFTAALSIYETIADGELDANVLFVSTSTEQARLVLNYSKLIIENSPLINPYFKIHRNQIINKQKGTLNKIEIKSSDKDLVQGSNTSFAVVDEIFYHEDLILKDRIKSGMASRTNPLQFVIGTVNTKESLTYELYESCLNILDEIWSVDSTMVYIFQQDDKEEIYNPETWRKSSPAIDYTVNRDWLLKEFKSAQLSETKKQVFTTDHLNFWSESVDQKHFVDDEIVKSIMSKTEYFIPTGSSVYVGSDFSSLNDLSSVAFLHYDKEQDLFRAKIYHIFPNNEKNKIKKGSIDLSKWWLPDGQFENDYDNNKYIIRCDTKSLDEDVVIDLITDINNRYKIAAFGFDPFNALMMVNRLESELFLTPEPVRQNYTMSFPLKFIEKLIEENRLIIDQSPVTRWQFKNLRIKTDRNNNYLITKNKGESVDGLVALTVAMTVFLKENGQSMEGLQNLYSYK